jgi:membrane fusion protein (multidrug efflux system)
MLSGPESGRMGRMSWLTTRSTPTLVLLTALTVVLISMRAFYTSEGSAKARARDARLEAAQTDGTGDLGPTLEVEIQVARSTPSVEIVELTGVLEPVRATWVAAEIAGRVLNIPAEEHGPVAKGDLLVQLDASLPRAELIRANAGHALAESELRRQERLGSRSVASEAELNRAQSEERNTFAALLEAQTHLARTRITAPFDGLVNSLDLDPGAYVQPGTKIAEILDLSIIEVTVLVSDRQVNVLAPGSPVSVRVDTLGSKPFQGRILRVGGAPADGGQRYPVVVSLEPADDLSVDDSQNDPARRLRPGMLARVQFEVGKSTAIRLPARSVLHEFELDYVFVLEDDDAVRRVRVDTRPVPFRPDQIEITSGLSEGTRVAVTAINQLRGGLRVIAR